MKITMYELLGLVKDGKAPKKIKYKAVILEYDEELTDYYYYHNRNLFGYVFTACNDFLNDEVEIIEEPKKIKKLPKEITDNVCATRDQKIIANKIDELIDEINNLKEND